MNKLFLAAAGMLIVAPALAQTPPPPSVGERSGVNSMVGTSPSTQDFVTEAAVSDMFEIQSSQLAVERGDAATKTFAQKMIADHQKTSSELKPLAQAKNLTVPAQLDNAHGSKLEKLKGLNGNDFLKQYHADQVSAHKDAVSLFSRYGKGGSDAELKQWAAKTEPDLEMHLKMAQDLDK